MERSLCGGLVVRVKKHEYGGIACCDFVLPQQPPPSPFCFEPGAPEPESPESPPGTATGVLWW